MADFDVIVVGARCAGSATAMALAKRGLRVLGLDRVSFPSDTISGHMIKPAGVASLQRWGLVDDLLATGCPPIRSRHVQAGDDVLELPRAPAGTLPPMAPRRTVLDALLVDAARAAGAQVAEGVALVDIRRDGARVIGVRTRDRAGREAEHDARVVVGADGRNSAVARLARAPLTHDLGTAAIAYYAYWRELDVPGLEIHFSPRRMVGLFPTHDDEVLAFVQWPVTERAAFRADVDGSYLRSLQAVEPLAGRLKGARRTSRVWGMAELPNFLRRPFGEGWALVGDAGHHKDPLVARGITDAWRDAELLAHALVAGWGDDDALAHELVGYERTRDRAALRVSELNAGLARLDLPVSEMLGAWSRLAAAEREADDLAALALARGGAQTGDERPGGGDVAPGDRQR